VVALGCSTISARADEFADANRPDGWNVWLTLSLSPSPPAEQTAEKSMVTK
jgi:hypothetical protein